MLSIWSGPKFCRVGMGYMIYILLIILLTRKETAFSKLLWQNKKYIKEQGIQPWNPVESIYSLCTRNTGLSASHYLFANLDFSKSDALHRTDQMGKNGVRCA